MKKLKTILSITGLMLLLLSWIGQIHLDYTIVPVLDHDKEIAILVLDSLNENAISRLNDDFDYNNNNYESFAKFSKQYFDFYNLWLKIITNINCSNSKTLTGKLLSATNALPACDNPVQQLTAAINDNCIDPALRERWFFKDMWAKWSEKQRKEKQDCLGHVNFEFRQALFELSWRLEIWRRHGAVSNILVAGNALIIGYILSAICIIIGLIIPTNIRKIKPNFSKTSKLKRKKSMNKNDSLDNQK